MRQTIQPKTLSETKSYSFDFSSLLGVGESVASATTTASVYSGTDATPSAVINGAATLASPLVTQSITGGVLGTIYELKCLATTTGVSPTQILAITAYLAIVPDLP